LIFSPLPVRSKNDAFECDLFYVANPDATARDVAKMQRLNKAVGEMLDAARSR